MISHIERLGSGRVLATDWDIALDVGEVPEGATAVGIRMHDIHPGPGKNSYCCRVVEEIENPFSYTVMLSPLNGKCTSPIGWELDKDTWKKLRSEEISISLPPEALLLLKD